MAGKTLDELKLSEQPIRSSVSDDRDTDWYQFCRLIDDVLLTAGYASDTLRGIQETVERTHRVTEGQRRAVENIQTSAGRRSRRYEGFGTSRARKGW